MYRLCSLNKKVVNGLKNPFVKDHDADTQEGQTTGIKNIKDIQIPNKVAIPVLAAIILIILLILFAPKLLKSNEPAHAVNSTQFINEPSAEATEIQVYPQKIRQFSEDGEESNPFYTESLENLLLTGIIANSSGKSTAILEAENASYIVVTGDNLPNSNWVVEDITDDTVVFSMEGNKKTIYMDSKK